MDFLILLYEQEMRDDTYLLNMRENKYKLAHTICISYYNDMKNCICVILDLQAFPTHVIRISYVIVYDNELN